MVESSDNPLAGPERSRIWDRTLVLLSERGQVEVESVRALVAEDVEVTPEAVREVLVALEERNWLAREDPTADAWLPGERARGVMDLPTRAASDCDDCWVTASYTAAVADALA